VTPARADAIAPASGAEGGTPQADLNGRFFVELQPPGRRA
jgi:hypothetical protein